MKFEKDDISDKMRKVALFAMAPEAVVENRLAGRRDLDSYAKVRCIRGVEWKEGATRALSTSSRSL